MLCLVSYDIPDDRRRLKLAKALLDFGNRVQYSVFECLLAAGHYAQMVDRIESIVDADEDSVRLYRLCAGCEKGIAIIGKGEISNDPEVYIL
jgi:CRISPR-associated protein Cas2